MTRMVVCVVSVSVAAGAVAAPVPKTAAADVALARVTVEHVGSALAQPGLRKQLVLTAEQEKKLAALTAEYEEKLKRVAGPEVVMGPFEYAKQVDLFKDISTVTREYDAAVVKLLIDAQHRRLRQVQLQKGGPAGLLNRHVVRALALTAEQEDALARELVNYRYVTAVTEELIGMAGMALDAKAYLLKEDGDGNAEVAKVQDALKALTAFLEKEHAEQEKVRQAMLRQLTAGQREMWAALIGKPVSGPELLRAGSILGDPRVMQATLKSYSSTDPTAPQPKK